MVYYNLYLAMINNNEIYNNYFKLFQAVLCSCKIISKGNFFFSSSWQDRHKLNPYNKNILEHLEISVNQFNPKYTKAIQYYLFISIYNYNNR